MCTVKMRDIQYNWCYVGSHGIQNYSFHQTDKNVGQQNLTWNKRRAADPTQLDACHDVFILDFDLRVPLCQYLQRHCVRTDGECDQNRMDASR